jgi:hypothetical protein
MNVDLLFRNFLLVIIGRRKIVLDNPADIKYGKEFGVRGNEQAIYKILSRESICRFRKPLCLAE